MLAVATPHLGGRKIVKYYGLGTAVLFESES
jgi:hypothetical protein